MIHQRSNVKQEEAHKLWLTVWDYNVIGSGEFLVRASCIMIVRRLVGASVASCHVSV
jgi:hypothetical protein